jgi:hypothetical protein
VRQFADPQLNPYLETCAMAELLLATIRTVAEQRADLLYALKSAAAWMSQGQHFPEMLDNNGQATMELMLAAIALADVPVADLTQEAA